MTAPTIATATTGDRGRAVGTVVEAFRADPAFRFFFPDDETYGEQAAVFAGHLFDKRVDQQSVWLVNGGASVSMWEPITSTQHAPEPSALPLPAQANARLDAYHEALHPALPRSPHWYLGVLATHPEHAGQRLGRLAMAAGLRRAASEGLPAYLETTNPGNVELYRRAGWEVTHTASVERVNIWVMTHSGGIPGQ